MSTRQTHPAQAPQWSAETVATVTRHVGPVVVDVETWSRDYAVSVYFEGSGTYDEALAGILSLSDAVAVADEVVRQLRADGETVTVAY
jgi:hypothetical protein